MGDGLQRAPHPTGNPTPESISRRARREFVRLKAMVTGGYYRVGIRVRGPVVKPQNIETRQRRRAAKQFAERAGIDIS